uniref:Uncharacterized protein n=1 Tax=Solanum tuberosum TaxID=4113 RepID=M1DW29_SOLTU
MKPKIQFPFLSRITPLIPPFWDAMFEDPSVLSLYLLFGGENLVGERKDKSASRRTVSRCSAISPKVTEPEDVEGKSKMAMEMTKGRSADWVGDPD